MDVQAAEASVIAAHREQEGGGETVGKGEESTDKNEFQYVNFQICKPTDLGSERSPNTTQDQVDLALTTTQGHVSDQQRLPETVDTGQSLTVSLVKDQGLQRSVKMVTSQSTQSTATSNGTPLQDDDQHNEEMFAATVIYQWIQQHGVDAEQLTDDHKFSSNEIKLFALSVARAIDTQCSTHGVSSLEGNAAWNSTAITLLALYKLGDDSWDMGMNLWGPGKGMIKEMISASLTKARECGYLEHDGKFLEVNAQGKEPAPQSNQNAQDKPKPRRRRHHRSHQYKLFGRGRKSSNEKQPATDTEQTLEGEGKNPEIHTAKIAEGDPGLVLEGDATENDTKPQKRKARASGKLSLKNSKKRRTHLAQEAAKTQPADATGVEPAPKLGSVENPIDLDEYDAEDFPINNVAAMDLRANRARAMWKVQSHARQRGKRDNLKIQWNGDPAELPSDLAIVAKAQINDTNAEAVFDTAAQVTCISREFWEKIGSPSITPVKGNVCGADGSQLKLMGAVRIKVVLGSQDFFYRAWVIDGLQSKILIGLDFIAWYKIDLLMSSMEAVCGGLRVPIWLEGWGRKKSRNMNAKVKVVATETLSIPAEHERFLPAVASTRIPKEWSNRMMIFEPN